MKYHRFVRTLVVLALLVLAAPAARANGRPPATSSIRFRLGHDQDVIAGMTFGLVASHDGGATWHWMCEKAIGYGGEYDPRYAYTRDGSLFATTFSGLVVSRDLCTFGPSVLATTFIVTEALGPDGALYAAATNATDSRIYRSDDDGATFPQAADAGMPNDFWQSILVAPSDARRVYLSGYRFAGQAKTNLLYRSSDGGKTFTPLPIADFTIAANSILEIAGVAAGNPDVVFVRDLAEDNQATDALYRSADGGAHWTRVFAGTSPLLVTVRAGGDIVAASRDTVSVSHDQGTGWQAVTGAPHISCLAESAGGELWACTRNYGTPDVPGDDAGIMKTTDLTSWTPVLRYQDIVAPIACAAGTAQHDSCEVETWCGLADQLGIQSTVIDCPEQHEAVPPPPKHHGCCEADGDPASPMLFALLVAAALARARRLTGAS